MSSRGLGSVLGNATKVLPVLAVGIVLYAVLVAGKVRPFHSVRVRGGPTEGATHLSYRLEVVERWGEDEKATAARYPVSLQATTSAGEALRVDGATDEDGAFALTLTTSHPVHGPLHLRVTGQGGELLVDDALELPVAQWAAGARRRGGWVQSRRDPSGITIHAAAKRGTFAVPFAGELLIDVRKERGDFQGTVTCECPEEHGLASVQLYPAPDVRFPLSHWVFPLEYATSASIIANDRDGSHARLDVSLGVVPGALRATLRAGGVLVESPIARDSAYVAIVSEKERIAGGTVRLHSTPQGTAEGVFEAALPVEGPLWAVVSSEPDLRSPALVGWPLRAVPGDDAPKTFDVPDVLVLDAVPARYARELGRQRRARFYSGTSAMAALLLTAVLVAWRARVAQAVLESHLARAGADEETTTLVAKTGGGARWVVLVAVLSIALAATLTGFFAAAL